MNRQTLFVMLVQTHVLSRTHDGPDVPVPERVPGGAADRDVGVVASDEPRSDGVDRRSVADRDIDAEMKGRKRSFGAQVKPWIVERAA